MMPGQSGFRRPARPLSRAALELVAARFRVLGEPLRLQILQALERGELSVSALAAATGTTQPNVSKHLRILEEAGLVRRRSAGTTVLCALADETVFELCGVVCHSLRARLAAQADLFPERGPRAGARGRPARRRQRAAA